MMFSPPEQQYLRIKLHCDFDYLMRNPCKDSYEQLTEDLLLAVVTMKTMGDKDLPQALNGVELMTMYHDKLVNNETLEPAVIQALARSVNVVDKAISAFDPKIYNQAIEMVFNMEPKK